MDASPAKGAYENWNAGYILTEVFASIYMPFEGLLPETDAQRQEEKETLDQLLSTDDREVLENGLEKLALIFTRMKLQKKLPTIILFPETSARPLVYAVKPVLDGIYARAGQKLPEYQFIATPKSSREQQIVEDFIDRYGEIGWEKSYMRHEIIRINQLIAYSEELIASALENVQKYKGKRSKIARTELKELEEKIASNQESIRGFISEIDALPQAITALKTERIRLKERLALLPTESRPFIVDDYMHNATTLRMLAHGLENPVPPQTTPQEATQAQWGYFAFYIDNTERIRAENKEPDPMYTDKDQYRYMLIELPKVLRYQKNFFVGTEGIYDYRGFKWRTPVRSETEGGEVSRSHEATGVTKISGSPSLFVERSPEADKRKMRILRGALVEIAQKYC